MLQLRNTKITAGEVFGERKNICLLKLIRIEALTFSSG